MTPEWKPLTDEQILAQLPAARQAGAASARREPRAVSARYDAEAERVVVELADGRALAFPPAQEPELRGFTPAQLAGVRVRPGGRGLFWEEPGAEVSVAGLLEGPYPARAALLRVAEPRATYGPDPAPGSGDDDA